MRDEDRQGHRGGGLSLKRDIKGEATISSLSCNVALILLILFFSLLWWGDDEALAWEFDGSNLEIGARGIDVAMLQTKLSYLGHYQAPIDGIFGPMTQEAIFLFQASLGLTPDGIVGPKTLQRLPSIEEMVEDFSQRDLLYLAQTITGEARGENFKGQVAVAAVVLNRVNDYRFPSTIRDVVLEQGQFTSVCDGQINYYYSDSALKAAKLALLGYDPTGGALFFYNPQIATEKVWITSREVVTRIGEHIFAY